MKRRLVILSIAALGICGCFCDKMVNKLPGYHQAGYQPLYDLAKTGQTFTLPKKLVEVSGLSSSVAAGRLLSLNDEEGAIYEIAVADGTIIRTIEHSKKDDYEGIARVGDSIYAVKSNGNIKVIDYHSGKKVDEISTPLKDKHDIEGLCYDHSRHRLLLAAKGDSELRGHKAGQRSIFGLDIDRPDSLYVAYRLQVEPLPATLLPDLVEDDILSRKVFRKRVLEFAPSGITIEPHTGQLYVLSARGALLAAIDTTGQMVSMTLLTHRLHRQAEGITIIEDGRLVIADEGGVDPGRLTFYTTL